MAQCTNVKVRCFACFRNLPIEGHSRIKINTKILDRWLKLDGWISNWNGCKGFSQGFKKFGPWVEKSNGFRLGWIEVKTIVREPVVNSLSARFYRSDLMCERRQVSTDIQLSVICCWKNTMLLVFERSGFMTLATGDIKRTKRSGPRTEPCGTPVDIVVLGEEDESILTKDVRLVR